MNDLPSMDRVKSLLMNWRWWAWDDVDSLEHKKICPMFAHITPIKGIGAYDEDSALLVEEVLRIMHNPYPKEWWILVAYYGAGLTQEEISERIYVHQTTVAKHRLPMARRIFAEQWADMIRRISPFDEKS